MKSERRVAITGIGVVAPLGLSYQALKSALFEGQSSVVRMTEWVDNPRGIATRLASPVTNFDPGCIARKFRRSMSRVAVFAVEATAGAMKDAGLAVEDFQNQRTGICYGSTMGGIGVLEDYFKNYMQTQSYTAGATSMTFLKIMSHTCAANIAITYAIPGPVVATCTACAASTQAIGAAYEAIKSGKLDRVVAGGAEELHIGVAAVFDLLTATSTKFNDSPALTPRPFDERRDGIVVGEGAGTLILEDYDLAKRRGARIYGEVAGYYSNNSSIHMTNPSVEGLAECVKGALDDAGITAREVQYVNAHATATPVGDAAEAQALGQTFGVDIKVSSTKGHIGHLMGATGAIEVIACLAMLEHKILLPTRNLDKPSEDCMGVTHIFRNEPMAGLNCILKNSFAFGGINASLILKGV